MKSTSAPAQYLPSTTGRPIFLVLGLLAMMSAIASPSTASGQAPLTDAVGVATSNGSDLIFPPGSSCALLRSGRVSCWGQNNFGQLGDGTTNYRTTAVLVQDLSDATKIAMGTHHTCALKRDGRVVCWGSNRYGQLGRPGSDPELVPVIVPDLPDQVVDLSAGGTSTCVISEQNEVYCWGPAARKGNDITNSGRGHRIFDLHAVKISVGLSHHCVITVDGLAKCWGSNTYGQLGDGTTNSSHDPVDVQGLTSRVLQISPGAMHTCALLDDGKVRCWGSNYFGQIGDGTWTDRLTPSNVSGLDRDIRSIATGDLFSCAIDFAGKSRCWGRNLHGQLGDGTTIDKNHADNSIVTSDERGYTAISAGSDHTCVLASNQSVRCWGNNSIFQTGDGSNYNQLSPSEIDFSRAFQVIDASFAHTCALDSSGHAWCWGKNDLGQLGNGNYSNHLIPIQAAVGFQFHQIETGKSHTCGIAKDDRMLCWGGNSHGQLGSGTTEHSNIPVQPVGLDHGVLRIALGDEFSCALLVDNVVKCWGSNFEGESGVPPQGDQLLPSVVYGLDLPVQSISAGSRHACVLFADQNVSCWGSNSYNLLGIEGITNSWTPISTPDLGAAVESLALGQYHTCAKLSTDAVKCWGANGGGQLGRGIFSTSGHPDFVIGIPEGVRAISAGSEHTCAITNEDHAKCWGRNSYGQLGIGSLVGTAQPALLDGNLAQIGSISAGYRHTCLVISDGSGYCWGHNRNGELGDGSGSWRPFPTAVLASWRVFGSGFER